MARARTRAPSFFRSRLGALEGLSTRAEIPRTGAYGAEKRQKGKQRKSKKRIIDSAPFLPRTTPVPLKVLLMMTAIENAIA